MELPFPTDLPSFAVWLALNGLTIAALLEKIPAFQRLDMRAKSLVVLGICLGSPFGAEGLQAAIARLPAETLAAVQHYLNLALTGLQVWAASQYAHGFNPLRAK